MMNCIKKKRNKKGFTLIELVVVIAILGILAAIAIPRFSGMRHEASIKAEGTTATSILAAARVQEADTGTAPVGANASTLIAEKYMIVPSGTGIPTYAIAVDGTSKLYSVTWTSTVTNYAGSQTVTEGTAWTPTGY